MIVYRLAAYDYIHDLSGTGAKMFGGRWNPEGVACIYTSQNLSLALLEKFVHAEFREQMQRISVLRLEIPEDEGLIFHVNPDLMKKSWASDAAYSQWLGSQILEDPSILAFTVPSAVVPAEKNVILNPLATAFPRISVISVTAFEMDFRLLSKLLERRTTS